MKNLYTEYEIQKERTLITIVQGKEISINTEKQIWTKKGWRKKE